MAPKVVVIGAGIAGLTAAHELAERGFRVVLVEKNEMLGGKARSYGVAQSGHEGRKELPAEHGFRLFPGFYEHLNDTMRRIPFGPSGGNVLGNLVDVETKQFARQSGPPLRFPNAAPRNGSDILAWLQAFTHALDLWIPANEVAYFAKRMAVLLSSCEERKIGEIDAMSWWDFVDAEGKSDNYRRYLAGGLTRSLIALRPEHGSARTIGSILYALIRDTAKPGRTSDRILNGPTNERWIDPWASYLTELGVEIRLGTRTEEFRHRRGRISSIVARKGNRATAIDADYFVLAVPLEVADRLLPASLKKLSPALHGLSRLSSEWMSGIQFFLDRDVPYLDGHSVLLDSPWALTSISQRRYWDVDLSGYGRGNVKGIISLIISNWDAPGTRFGKAARNCTAREIRDEVWAQVSAHLNAGDRTVLDDSCVIDCHLDASVTFDKQGRPANGEPLFVNTAGSWRYRPEAGTDIDNLVLASDYVRTNTDLATMEGANEAGRRAVNAILSRAPAISRSCQIWSLPEPPLVMPLKSIDSWRFKRGLPHLMGAALGGSRRTLRVA